MEIILGKNSGFCGGVANAVKKTEQILESNNKVYCLGELVHNKQILEKLEKKGLVTIENIKEAEKGSIVIIRAHGEQPITYEIAKQRNINLIDLTCQKVEKIHKIAENNKDKFIFLIAVKGHPETIGTFGFCGENSSIIQTEEDINLSIEKLKKSELKKVLIIAQTTFSVEKFELLVQKIKETIPDGTEIEINKTICDATKIRQEETEEISKKVDGTIIIGGKNSSNTQKLYEISIQNCKKVFFIQTKEDLNLADLNGINKLGIMAGVSTQPYIIEEVIEYIKKDSKN